MEHTGALIEHADALVEYADALLEVLIKQPGPLVKDLGEMHLCKNVSLIA